MGIGYIVPEYFKWPGYLSPNAGIKFADVPNGLGALSKVPASGWAQIFIFCGALDTGFFVYDESREPGDYANGGQGSSQDEAQRRACEWSAGYDGHHRHVLPGRPHRRRLGRLGAVHWLPAALSARGAAAF